MFLMVWLMVVLELVGFALNGDEHNLAQCKPLAVFIMFDDCTSGKFTKTNYKLNRITGAVAIEMSEVKFLGNNGRRN